MRKAYIFMTIVFLQIITFGEGTFYSKNISKVPETSPEASYEFKQGEYKATLEIFYNNSTKKHDHIFIAYKWPTDQKGNYLDLETLKEADHPEVREIKALMIEYWCNEKKGPPFKIRKRALNTYADLEIETVS